jgi:hypothetical protein
MSGQRKKMKGRREWKEKEMNKIHKEGILWSSG